MSDITKPPVAWVEAVVLGVPQTPLPRPYCNYILDLKGKPCIPKGAPLDYALGVEVFKEILGYWEEIKDE